MNIRVLPLLALTAAAGLAGWFAARNLPRSTTPAPNTGIPTERRILHYQSAMHPWIKSDRPGRCTICGMELTPILEGDPGFGAAPGMVSLASNSVTVLNVGTTRVRRGPLTRTLRVAGTIDDDDTRHRFISATVAGRIDELSVNFIGAEVDAGEPLALFYSPMLLEAERQFIALRNTPAPSGAAAEHDLLHASATQRLRQLGLTDPQIQSLPSKHATNIHSEILAPVSGTVVSRFVYPGQYVMEGEKLFEIADFSTMWFRFDAYEQDLPWLQPGQTVEITTPSLPGRTFTAPIRFIDPNLDDPTRSAKVRVEIPNPPVPGESPARRALRHRLYAEGRVQMVAPEVLLVPRSAVLSADGRPVVYLDRSGGTYEQRLVTLGRIGDRDHEVLRGLEPDDLVVTTGNLLIDAQAQLNQVIHDADPAHSTTHPTPHPDTHPAATHAPLPRLTGDQSEAVNAFLQLADTARAALAADDLPAFNTAAARLEAAAGPLTAAFPGTPGTPPSPWLPAIQSVAARSRLQPFTDLRSARRSYHAFATPLVDLALALRRDGDPDRFRGLRVYQCPMTAEAFDGAPARARWLQLSAPLRNPWFGAEMLECGVEVQP